MVNKKEWNTDMYYNMDEPWGGNKLVIKVYILYYFHFYKILRIDKSIEIEKMFVVAWSWDVVAEFGGDS